MGVGVQIIGSLLVLAGFALSQWGVLDPKSLIYLIVNAVGSGILAVDAFLGEQWGFLLLEGVWAIVSVIGLIQVLWARRATSPSHQDASSKPTGPSENQPTTL